MSKKTVVAIAIIAALAIVLGATYMLTRPVATPDVAPNAQQGDTTEQGINTDTKKSTETSPQTESETAGTATITYTNEGFSPASLTVKSGTTLQIVNNSDTPLEFSSDNHPTHRENPEMNMSTLQPGGKGTVTVTTVGEHGFHDHLNASHTGVLTVTE